MEIRWFDGIESQSRIFPLSDPSSHDSPPFELPPFPSTTPVSIGGLLIFLTLMLTLMGGGPD
jgi:hypothetical protein